MNILYTLDKLIATTTNWNALGQFTGYSVLTINLAPIDSVVGILIGIIILTIAVWPKKNG